MLTPWPGLTLNDEEWKSKCTVQGCMGAEGMQKNMETTKLFGRLCRDCFANPFLHSWLLRGKLWSRVSRLRWQPELATLLQFGRVPFS